MGPTHLDSIVSPSQDSKSLSLGLPSASASEPVLLKRKSREGGFDVLGNVLDTLSILDHLILTETLDRIGFRTPFYFSVTEVR